MHTNKPIKPESNLPDEYDGRLPNDSKEDDLPCNNNKSTHMSHDDAIPEEEPTNSQDDDEQRINGPK